MFCITTYREHSVARQLAVRATGARLWLSNLVTATVLLTGGSSVKNLVKYLCKSCCRSWLGGGGVVWCKERSVLLGSLHLDHLARARSTVGCALRISLDIDVMVEADAHAHETPLRT